MDKYALVLHIIDHPEEYTSAQLQQILSDPETREIYNLLSKVDSAASTSMPVDVDAEWTRFSAKLPRRRFFWQSSRAAVIAAIIGSSVVAVAGIALAVSKLDFETKQPMDETPLVQTTPARTSVPATMAIADSSEVAIATIQFEDATLEEIITTIGKHYGLKIQINNPESGALHLFYKFNPGLSVEDVLAQLNTFEQLSITLNGDTIEVD